MTTQAEGEAARMQRVAGIVFADGTGGRVPRIQGTGLEVFEIIRLYREHPDDFHWLRGCFDWLSEDQLRAALRYYALYPEEVDERLREEDAITPRTLYAQHPFMDPRP